MVTICKPINANFGIVKSTLGCAFPVDVDGVVSDSKRLKARLHGIRHLCHQSKSQGLLCCVVMMALTGLKKSMAVTITVKI